MEKSNFHQSVLITGANRGLGLGYVKFYLKKGVPVVATALNPTLASELLRLQKEYPNQLLLVELNVAQESSIGRFVSELKSNRVTISIAINNAGVSMGEAFGNWTMASFENHFRINTIGPALVSQAIVPFLSDGSKLVQISSGMSSLAWNINPEDALDAYAASKCALHSITVRLADKLKPENIGVFAINPGWVKTRMGGEGAPRSVDEAMVDITETIEKLTMAQTGSFISETGTAIPW